MMVEDLEREITKCWASGKDDRKMIERHAEVVEQIALSKCQTASIHLGKQQDCTPMVRWLDALKGPEVINKKSSGKNYQSS